MVAGEGGNPLPADPLKCFDVAASNFRAGRWHITKRGGIRADVTARSIATFDRDQHFRGGKSRVHYLFFGLFVFLGFTRGVVGSHLVIGYSPVPPCMVFFFSSPRLGMAHGPTSAWAFRSYFWLRANRILVGVMRSCDDIFVPYLPIQRRRALASCL